LISAKHPAVMLKTAMQLFLALWNKAVKAAGAANLVSWLGWLFGLSGAGVVAWASTSWTWYWTTLQWAGVAIAFMVALMALSLSFYLSALAVSACKSPPSTETPASPAVLKARLRAIHEEGVKLRNEGNHTTRAVVWTWSFAGWHRRVLAAAQLYSQDLRNHLEPVNKFKEPPEPVAINDPDHAMNVRIASEILARIDKWLTDKSPR
jgi:hypothetical protein